MPHKQSRHLNAEQRARALIHKLGETGIRQELRQRVDTALNEATDAKTLAAALRQHGVRWHNTNRDGRKGFSFSADQRADIWIAGGEIDASRRQVAQRLKANALQVQQEQQRQEHELQQRDPALADFLAAQRLVNLGNPGPPAAGPLTPAEAEPERSHLDGTRGSELDNGPGR